MSGEMTLTSQFLLHFREQSWEAGQRIDPAHGFHPNLRTQTRQHYTAGSWRLERCEEVPKWPSHEVTWMKPPEDFPRQVSGPAERNPRV